MLTDLHINDVVLIDQLALNFRAGFTALTGETGAGKSIVLDALGLALGQRAETRLIRAGAQSAQVTAAFDITNKTRLALLQNLFTEHDMTLEIPLVLRRVVSAGGSKNFINDMPVSLNMLKSIGALLVETHGQFDTHDLLEVKQHRTTLDAFGGYNALLDEVRTAWTTWRAAVTAFETLQQELADAARRRDDLQATIDELRVLNPQQGEEEKLAADRALMMHAEKIMQALGETENALTADINGTGGASARLQSALRSLERVADKVDGALDEVIAGLNRAVIELDEALNNVEALADRMAFDRETQGNTDERLFALRGAARKYNVTVAALPDVLAHAEQALQALDDQSSLLAAAEKKVNAAQKIYDAAAVKLTAARVKAGEALAKAVKDELPPLKLERAQFAVDITSKTPSADGADQVTFMAAMNAGGMLQPLHKVASGGEMARVMLVLKLVTQNADAMPTLIFDEIDTGVSGAVAEAIGLRLRRLGSESDTQVFAVTHAPQVAAKAHAHFLIRKESDTKSTRTHVTALDDTQRVDEIARLLSGEKITAAARDTALHLLDVEAAAPENLATKPVPKKKSKAG